MNIIPGTIVGAFANGDILQVLLISLLCGAAFSALGKRVAGIVGSSVRLPRPCSASSTSS